MPTIGTYGVTSSLAFRILTLSKTQSSGWAASRCEKEEGIYAIDVDGPVGTISFHPGQDGFKYSAEVGYWLGEDYWGRGIMTEAVRVLSRTIFEHTEFVRLYAPVFSWNSASMRVLEKAGFAREGILRRSQFKDGKLLDRVIYAKVRDTGLPYEPFGC